MFVKVKVSPASKSEDLIRKSADSFEIKVKEKAERGLANKVVIRLLSSHFNVPVGRIRLIKGGRQKSKIFEISGV